MSEKLPPAVLSRLITYPYPAAQTGHYGPQETGISEVPANTSGAARVSAEKAGILHAVTSLTLGVVTSRQAAADALGDDAFSAKMLTVNEADLDRFCVGIRDGVDLNTLVPPICPPPTPDPVLTESGWLCIPATDGSPIKRIPPDWGRHEPEAVVAVGMQVLATSEAIPDGPLRSAVVEIGNTLVDFGMNELGGL